MAEGAPGPTSQAGAAVPPATHHLPHHTLAFELFGEGVDPSRALVECALHGTYQDARRLLKLGADVTAEFYHPTTRETETALGNAVWRGHWQLVKLLLEEGADPDQFDSLTCGPLIEAVRSDDTRTATLLLKGGADPNLEINAEASPMHALMGPYCTDPEIIRLLMDYGGDPNLNFGNWFTPLHNMAREGGGPAEFRKLSLLLNNGVDVFINARDENGYTPLETAIVYNNKKTLSTMLHLDEFRELDHHRFLHVAVEGNQLPMVKWLVQEKHWNINTLCEDTTPLQTAADCGLWDMVQWFMDHGGKVGPLQPSSVCPCQVTSGSEEPA